MKIVDQSYQCTVPGQEFGTWQLRCYLQIFHSSLGQYIVMVSDMGCETGWFVPYKIEQLASHIAQKFQLDCDRLIWIEHCPANTSRPKYNGFSQVSFEWQTGKATNPQWQPIDEHLAEVLRKETAQLATACSV